MPSSSDRLHKLKVESELNSRIDEISKRTMALKKDIDQLKKIIHKNHEEHTKQIRELYVFTKKLEDIYSNGLTSTLSTAPISVNGLDYTSDDSTEQSGTHEDLFVLDIPFRYDQETRDT